MTAEKITISKGVLTSVCGFAMTALITVSWAFLNYRITENKTVNDSQGKIILETLIEVKRLNQALQDHIDRDKII